MGQERAATVRSGKKAIWFYMMQGCLWRMWFRLRKEDICSSYLVVSQSSRWQRSLQSVTKKQKTHHFWKRKKMESAILLNTWLMRHFAWQENSIGRGTTSKRRHVPDSFWNWGIHWNVMHNRIGQLPTSIGTNHVSENWFQIDMKNFSLQSNVLALEQGHWHLIWRVVPGKQPLQSIVSWHPLKWHNVTPGDMNFSHVSQMSHCVTFGFGNSLRILGRYCLFLATSTRLRGRRSVCEFSTTFYIQQSSTPPL